MRSSRVREETPQPTMRVTDGSSDLSMICREETWTDFELIAFTLRQSSTGIYTNAHKRTHSHTHTSAASGCAIWNGRQLPVGKQLNGTIRPRMRQGDPKVNMSERWSGKLNKWSGSLRSSIELLSQQMRRVGCCTYISVCVGGGCPSPRGSSGGGAVLNH